MKSIYIFCMVWYYFDIYGGNLINAGIFYMKKTYSYKFDVFQNDKNIDLTMFQYGWEQCAPLHSFGPAKRNHYLFHYVFSGTGYLRSIS